MAYIGELQGLPSQDGQADKFLTTDGMDASWKSPKEVISLADGKDVTITNPVTGQLLKWNGTAWVNATVFSLSGTTLTITV